VAEATPTDEPVSRGRRRRTRRRRRVVAAVAAVATVLALGAGAVWWRLYGNIQRIDVSGSLSSDRPSLPDGPLNILLIGSDTRVGQDQPDTGSVEGARSDTTLLAHLSADRDHVTVVSIPRDSMVPVAPDCDASVPTDQWPVQQFNAAFAMGGAACTVNTVEQDTGLRVNHVAVVDFTGFTDMVDALGGVPVCTPVPIDDPKAHLDIPAGRQVLDGAQALGYVRTRYTEGDGSDLGRIKRQQAFLSSVVQEATRTSLLLRPDKLLRFLDAATRSLTTDSDFGVGTMEEVASSVKDIGISSVQFVTVPVEDYPEDPNRVQWSDAADSLWATLRADRVLGESASSSPTPTSGPLTVSPADVQVEVVNATGVAGLAAQAAAALEVQGFPTPAVSSTPERPTGVVVQYGTGQDDAARTVAAAFEGATLEERPDLTAPTVRVVLGGGAPAVREVPNRLGAAPLPTPTVSAPAPSATPSIETRTADQDICS
jgi:LCP family protein required for cell wall assembly